MGRFLRHRVVVRIAVEWKLKARLTTTRRRTCSMSGTTRRWQTSVYEVFLVVGRQTCSLTGLTFWQWKMYANSTPGWLNVIGVRNAALARSSMEPYCPHELTAGPVIDTCPTASQAINQPVSDLLTSAIQQPFRSVMPNICPWRRGVAVQTSLGVSTKLLHVGPG